jgi:hypothetical protein
VANLSQRSVRSGAATLIARALQLLLQLVMAMVLARLVTPADFGVQAMVLPLAVLVNGIANAGLQSAIIQRDDPEHAQSNAIFWRALSANGLLCGLMMLLAPVVAIAYREPRVFGVAIVWALVIFLATFSAVPEALLKREMRFASRLNWWRWWSRWASRSWPLDWERDTGRSSFRLAAWNWSGSRSSGALLGGDRRLRGVSMRARKDGPRCDSTGEASRERVRWHGSVSRPIG